MNRIKIVGLLVFTLSIVLALLSNFIANQESINRESLIFINKQKESTQEISKSILYLYKSGENGSKILDKNIKKYLKNTEINRSNFYKNRTISNLWSIFYKDVNKFKNQQKITTGYNSVITARLVNRIYHNNLLLVNEFNNILNIKLREYQQDINGYKQIEYSLFAILILLLIYLFTQIQQIIKFIQKFSKTSKSIIENSTIQGLEPMERIEQEELKEATDNYNHLVEKINYSIDYSNKSINQTTKSLEEVAKNIEDFMELLSTMQEDESDKLFEKEDVVIDSLESLMRLRKKLKTLQKDLNNLISTKE